jgi:arginyl-tRNA synthetase
MKEKIVDFLKEHCTVDIDFSTVLEVPKLHSQGDFSLPCFMLAKELKQSPQHIAQELEENLSKKLPAFLSSISASGPFLNFYINPSVLSKEILHQFSETTLPSYQTKTPQKIVIEYPSPNTNKSLHVGHSRNMLLGTALVRLQKYVGHTVITVNLNNDRGIAVCKSMLSYQLFGEGKTPQDLGMKPDEFVSHFYVLYGEKNKAHPELELDKKAQEMLVAWEAGDVKVRELWKKILSWVFEGYSQTYKKYKLPNFDKEYFESEIYDKGKSIVLEALEKKVKGFGVEEDGAVYVDLEDAGFDKKYLLRGDGTTLYMTQDIYLAQLKDTEFSADTYVFVVGVDQKYHFQVLFEVLDRLGFGGVDKNYHFAYGYVYDKDGKKFSSRLGNTIGADEVYDEIVKKAKENLLQKELTKNLDEQELERRSKIIGFGALAFTFLKQNPLSDMNFSMEAALSFEGETGPYCQYTYARIQSILKKSSLEISEKDINYSVYGEYELALIKKLGEFSSVIKEASEKYKISHLANYVLRISQLFNEMYQNCPILKAETQELQIARLYLASITGRVIKEVLGLLSIEVLEEM